MKIATPCLLLALVAAHSQVTADERETGVEIVPRAVTLFGSEAQQKLLLQNTSDGQVGSQYRSEIRWEASDGDIVEVTEAGELHPLKDGQVTVTATTGSGTASVNVEVRNTTLDHEWSFRNDVQSVLAKVGCNSGACHGALAGKGGLKLSLRGYDTLRDYHTITREAKGRRIELSDPGRSLLLAKPTAAIPHKGGLRFDVDSLAYRIISGWIAAGAPAPRESDPQLERIEVFPRRVTVRPGDRQQILVTAHYSDGRSADVTRWAKFTSANEAVATVGSNGDATIVGRGEGAVTAWFASKIAIARLTVPYGHSVPAQEFVDQPRRNFIDHHVLAQLERLQLRPSPPASDAEFHRRAFLDTIGVLPTAEETRLYLADSNPDKRGRLIETLLARPEFVDYWSYRWSDVLLVTGERLRPLAVKAYYTWIRGHVEQNTPWDEFVRQIITAQGSSHENGATNFYALHQDPETMSENAAQAFLGLSIGCAKCHNHPLEKWTNQQYYAMANLFSRVRAKGWGGDPRNGDGLRTVMVVDRGELVQPLTGKPQPPTPLDGTPLPFDDPRDRREHLADWLTDADNPYFARSIANRVWANFFGVGLVEQVDDMRDSNPASNEELLTAAAEYLVEHDFDLKALMRVILNSHAYQRSSQPLEENSAEKRFYARYYPRRLMAEVLLDAISQVTGEPTKFTQIAYPGADFQDTDFYPKGTRALQLYDAAVHSYFLKTFGRNERAITCECERSDEPSMVQVLHLSNGDTINEKLAATGNRVETLASSERPLYAVVEEIYLTALGRFPTDNEMRSLLEIAGGDTADRRTMIEDIMWSVLTSREFLFNH